jgi:hypothetical protein
MLNRSHKTPTLDPIPSQFNPVHIFSLTFSPIRFEYCPSFCTYASQVVSSFDYYLKTYGEGEV